MKKQSNRFIFIISLCFLIFGPSAISQDSTQSLKQSYQLELAAAGSTSDSLALMISQSEKLVNSEPYLGKEIGLQALQMARSLSLTSELIYALHVTSANYLNLGALDSAMRYLNEAKLLISKS